MVAEEAIRQLWKKAKSYGLRCIACGWIITLDELEVSMYPHDNGLPLSIDSEIRFWVYFTCPRCRYQNSVTKVLEVEMS
jgi:hypothetical protein